MDYFSESIKKAIRTVPDWPKPGVSFRDITTVLQDKTAFRKLIDAFVHRYHGQHIDAVAAVDARGFIIGSALAYELNASLVLVRKKGKLPRETVGESYALEYGETSYSSWSPYMAPIKIVMCFGILLMLLQAIAFFFKDLAATRGLTVDGRPLAETEQAGEARS